MVTTLFGESTELGNACDATQLRSGKVEGYFRIFIFLSVRVKLFIRKGWFCI